MPHLSFYFKTFFSASAKNENMGNEKLSLVLFIDENVYNDYTLGERDNDETRTRMICRHRKRKRKKEKGRKVRENVTEKEEK